MYKTKLQELCHQFAWNLPEYATEKDGPDHNPRFTATVTVNGVSFESPKDQCRSSKEAQNHAAQIAYDHFTVPQSTLFSPHNLPSPAVLPTSSGDSKSKSKVGDIPPNVDIFQQRQNKIGQLSCVNGTPLAGVDTNTSRGGQLDKPLQVLPASSECAVADVSQLVVQQKTKLIIEELSLQNEEVDTNAKRHRCSTAPNTYSLIRDVHPAAPSSTSDSTDAAPESADSASYAGTGILPNEKIFIFPRNANMELPSGASVLPCSDKKWVAGSLELNRNHELQRPSSVMLFDEILS